METFSPRGELDTRVVTFLPFSSPHPIPWRLIVSPSFSDTRPRNHAIPLSDGSEITIAWKARMAGNEKMV